MHLLYRTKLGCDITHTYIPPYVPWVFYGITTATFQIILLGLFFYPLSRQKNISRENTNKKRERSHLMPLMKRSFGACAACVFSNLVVSIIVIVTDEPYNIIPIFAYNINLITDLVAVIISFSKWRLILFPFCYKAKISTLKLSDSFEISSSHRTLRASNDTFLNRAFVGRQISVFSLTDKSSSLVDSSRNHTWRDNTE